MKVQRIVAVATAMSCALLVSGCGKSQIEWKEEVKTQEAIFVTISGKFIVSLDI